MNTHFRFKHYWLAVENIINEISLFLYDAFVFGKYTWFWKIRFCLWREYFFCSPFKIVSKVHKSLNVPFDNLIYGETPFVSFRHIVANVALIDNFDNQSLLKFCDLGAGTGKVVFFASSFYKFNSTGLEIVPDYVEKANKIVSKLKMKDIQFINIDFKDFDLSGFDIIYVPATTWDEKNISGFTEKIGTLKEGACVISVSVPMESPFLKEIKKFRCPFSWGVSFVYCAYKKSPK